MINIPDSDPLYNLQGKSTQKKKKCPSNPPIMETTIGKTLHLDTEDEPVFDPSIITGHAIAMIGKMPLPPGLLGKCTCTQYRRNKTLLKLKLPKISAKYIAELEKMALPQLIRHLRISRYMTQHDLAYLSGLRKSSISMYENDRRIPRLNSVRYMGEAMKLRKREMEVLQKKVAGHLILRAMDEGDFEKMKQAEDRALGRTLPLLFGVKLSGRTHKPLPMHDDFCGADGHARLQAMNARVTAGLSPHPQDHGA